VGIAPEGDTLTAPLTRSPRRSAFGPNRSGGGSEGDFFDAVVLARSGRSIDAGNIEGAQLVVVSAAEVA
jgi:hypothetical protein